MSSLLTLICPLLHGRVNSRSISFLSTSSQTAWRRRNARGLPPPTDNVNVSEALKAFRQDATVETKELGGWSALYYRYVCSHLELSQEEMSKESNIHERTLRRYQQYALEQLTDDLTKAEWQARVRRRRQRLYNQLPMPVPTRLFGREQAFERARHCVEGAPPRHLFVSGISGIGKTAFAQEFVRLLIDSESVDQVVWLNAPVDTQQVRDSLAEQLFPDSLSISLRDYLTAVEVAVVLDGLSNLLVDVNGLCHLLQDLSRAVVMLVHDSYMPLPVTHVHLPLEELEQGDTAELIAAVVEPEFQAEKSALADLCEMIWERVGGHPLAAKLLALHTEFIHPQDETAPGIAEQIYERAYHTLPTALKRGWWMMALLPPGAVRLDTLAALWPDSSAGVSFDALTRRHLIEKEGTNPAACSLTTAARQYLQGISVHALDDFIYPLLTELDKQIQSKNTAALGIVEYLLQLQWLGIPAEIRHAWLRTAWETAVVAGQCARWRPLLEQAVEETDDLYLQIAYGICLRRLSSWHDAGRALERAMAQAGRQGEFGVQATCLLELAVLARYRGDYEHALMLLQRAERIAGRYGDDDLRQGIRIEYAQIAVDKQDGDLAIQQIEGVPDTVRSLALRGEAWILSGYEARGRQIIAPVFDMLHGEDAWAEGRLYTLVGRVFEQEGDLAAAQYHLLMALNRFDGAGDVFAAARGQCNLGAVLTKLGECDEAESLLKQAEETQRLLGDEIGLTHTRHNLNVLYIHCPEAGASP